jgi:NADPH-dependent 2,4-dienoyl-CoA reductase/sulfur reductase-like enzyme
MSDTSRRQFLKQISLLPLSLGLGLSACRAKPMAEIVVIGGGFGGATCARYLRELDPKLSVTLIDANASYTTCPFSNYVFAGLRTLDDLTFNYDQLKKKFGVNVVHAKVERIVPDKKTLHFSDGSHRGYDKLVISPGVQFRWGSPEGYDLAASQTMPHAWKAGAQTLLLNDQLRAMPDGGVVAISVPPKPFRCPPGPYERASMMASYLHQQKPKSKILILDANEGFAKQALFEQAWEQRYAGMIERVSVSEGGSVHRVDPTSNTLYTDLEEFKVDVANVIPAQTAAKIVTENALTDASGWCPINSDTFESTLIKDIHILGDACLAGAMPKSATSANSQAKVCARSIVAELNDREATDPEFYNICYSLVDEAYGISISASYHSKEGKIAKIAGTDGLSPIDATADYRMEEADHAKAWYDSITYDTFG